MRRRIGNWRFPDRQMRISSRCRNPRLALSRSLYYLRT